MSAWLLSFWPADILDSRPCGSTCLLADSCLWCSALSTAAHSQNLLEAACLEFSQGKTRSFPRLYSV